MLCPLTTERTVLLSVPSLTTSLLSDLPIAGELQSHSDQLKRLASSLLVALAFTQRSRKNRLNNLVKSRRSKGRMYYPSTGLRH